MFKCMGVISITLKHYTVHLCDNELHVIDAVLLSNVIWVCAYIFVLVKILCGCFGIERKNKPDYYAVSLNLM